MYSVQCTLQNCKMYSVHSTCKIIVCILYNVHYRTVICILYTTVYSVKTKTVYMSAILRFNLNLKLFNKLQMGCGGSLGFI